MSVWSVCFIDEALLVKRSTSSLGSFLFKCHMSVFSTLSDVGLFGILLHIQERGLNFPYGCLPIRIFFVCVNRWFLLSAPTKPTFNMPSFTVTSVFQHAWCILRMWVAESECSLLFLIYLQFLPKCCFTLHSCWPTSVLPYCRCDMDGIIPVLLHTFFSPDSWNCIYFWTVFSLQVGVLNFLSRSYFCCTGVTETVCFVFMLLWLV